MQAGPSSPVYPPYEELVFETLQGRRQLAALRYEREQCRCGQADKEGVRSGNETKDIELDRASRRQPVFHLGAHDVSQSSA